MKKTLIASVLFTVLITAGLASAGIVGINGLSVSSWGSGTGIIGVRGITGTLQKNIVTINDIKVRPGTLEAATPATPQGLSQDPTCTPQTEDFTLISDAPLGSVTQYYQDTKCTGLKWATNDQSTGTLQWATDTSYGEPVWNGTSYDYPSGRTEADYPAFKHCTDLGATWRVPTRGELESIIDRYKPSAPYSYLPDIASAVYWSSVQYRANTNNAWNAYMTSGQVSNGNKHNHSRVVCVSE